MLPKNIDLTSMGIGDTETKKRPNPKNEVNISPIIVSFFSLVYSCRNRIVVAANPPAKNAPMANGKPRI